MVLFLRNLFLSTRVLQGLEFMINGCFPRSRKMVEKHRELGSHHSSLRSGSSFGGKTSVYCDSKSSLLCFHRVVPSRFELRTRILPLCAILGPSTPHSSPFYNWPFYNLRGVMYVPHRALIQQGLLLSQVTSLKDILPLIRLKAHSTFYTLHFTLLHHYSRLYLTWNIMFHPH